MSNAIFPALPGLTWGTDWDPQFKTKMQAATSGKEYRASLMSSPVYSFKLKYEFLRSASRQELQTLFGFFLARRGAFDNFLYSFPDDCAVTDQFIGMATGTQTNFQLVRGLSVGFAEPVQNINQIVNVKVNGVPMALGADYTVSATGLVMFAAAPSAGSITWSGSYYYRARFTKDNLPFTSMMRFIYECKSLEMIASLGLKI
ncbi:DUF2460 domain-containing protein [Undibacterium sp. SXout11W]|uniref:DUF2460 domain-containing protein n=1 Tax=Undibacterium sp. SXout11W TaxID=3413050 RepID=UPI003BF0DB5B